MAFADNGEDELDYEDDELLETGGLRGGERGGTAAIAGLMEEEELEDEEYEDLYGDVNVGMFSTTPHSPSHHPLQSGRGGPAVYGDADSGGDEEEEYPTIGDTEELQGFGAPKEGTLKAQPRQAEAFHAVGGDPQLGSQADGMENFYGEQEVVVAGPSDVKSKLEHGMELGVLSGQPGKPTSLKDRVGKSMPIAGGGLNGISGSEAAGIGRTTAWVPSTAGPSGLILYYISKPFFPGLSSVPSICVNPFPEFVDTLCFGRITLAWISKGNSTESVPSDGTSP